MNQRLESQKKIDVHDYETRIRQVKSQIERELSLPNVRLLEKYDQEMVRQTIALATRQKHLRTMLNLTRLLGKEWLNTTKEDLDDLVYKVMKMYSDGTGKETNYSYDHKKILKIFFRWMKLGSREFKEVGDPDESKGIRMRKVRDKIIREDLLTDEDRIKLLHVCGGNARDKAFIDCHFEAGTRPGEILNLQIKHVKFDKYGAVLHVDGKTGPRTIRLVRATPSLAAWLDSHPLKDNPNAPLWPNLSHHKYGEPLTYPGVRLMLRKRCKMANISKRIFLNLFRHSEATRTANFMTEAQMRKRHGWSSDSKMPSKYVHLVNSDVENVIFSHYGIKDDEKEKETMPQKCQYCQIPNSADSKSCVKCGKPLSLDAAVNIDEGNQSEMQELKEQMIGMQKQNEKQIAELKTGFEMILEHISGKKLRASKNPKTVVRSQDGAILYQLIQ